MAGQGSPTTIADSTANRPAEQSPRTSPRRLVGLVMRVLIVAWTIAIAFSTPNETTAQFPQHSIEKQSLDLRLRISLGGGAPARWQGQISIDNDPSATFADLTPFGFNGDANASIWLRDGQIMIDHEVETDYNAIDVSVRCIASAKLTVDLTSKDHPNQQTKYSIPLIDLIAGGNHRKIDETFNQCSINRVPGDMLRFNIKRPHLIFKPGEPIEFSVTAVATPFTSSSCLCRVAMTPARRSKNAITPWRTSTTMTCDDAGSSTAATLNLKAPSREGVYDLTLELHRSSFSTGFSKRPKVVRKVQFVVLEKESPSRNTNKRWRTIEQFTPERLLDDDGSSWQSQFSSSINQLKSGRLSPTTKQPCLGNTRRRLADTQHGTALQLEPGGWQAIPISVPNHTDLCMIEVDCVVDNEMALGISLLQPDSNNQISSLRKDSGVAGDRIRIGSFDPTVHTHRIYHWPTDTDAWLVLANRHAKQNSEVIEVRISSGPERIPVPSPSVSTKRFSQPKREMMAFLETPSFPEDFGAREYLDPTVGQPLDDWITFYEGADRLIQCLKSKRLSGAFIAIAADGSGLFPSNSLALGPRYDNGGFLANGNDPMRKDVVELLFRMFEREGLQLVPVLTLNGPLDKLRPSEATRLVNFSGVQARADNRKFLPRHNPLAPSVQQAVVNVVQEIVNRYQHHESFRGLAITCRPDCVTLLPGRQWANDRATIGRFIEASGIENKAELDKLDQPSLVAALLRSHYEQWLKWRATEMSNLYQQLERTLTDKLPGGTLYLAPIDLYRNAEIAAVLTPNLHTSGDYVDAMLRMGFDPQRATKDGQFTNTVILNPHRIAQSEPLASRRVDLQVAGLDQINDFFLTPRQNGDLFVHRSNWAHFAQLQLETPFLNQRAPLMRQQQLTLVGASNLRRLVERIKSTDTKLVIDSDWSLPSGDTRMLSSINQVFTQLPIVSFEDVSAVSSDGTTEISTESLPVAVRQFSSSDESWFYAVNASPWPIQVQLLLKKTDSGDAKPFSALSATELTMIEQDGKQFVRMTIPPWNMAGGYSSDPRTRLQDFSIEFPQVVDVQLKKEIFRLQSLLVQSSQSQPLGGVTNPDFEASSTFQNPLPGWSTGPEVNSESVKLTTIDVHQGKQALHLTSNVDSPTWIRSNEFAAPESGRVSISAWLKTDRPDQPVPLRISLEEASSNSNYYRFGSIGGLSPTRESNQVGDQWQRFAVHFDDLPLENLDRLRVGFDLMGPGSVMIDHVEVFDRWFDENDSKAITQLLATAGTLVASPDTYDQCRRLLESYWPSFLIKHFETVSNEQIAKLKREPTVPAKQASFPNRGQSKSSEPSVNEALNAKQGILRFRNVFGPRRPKVR